MSTATEHATHAPHPHTHSEDCGHVAVEHGDHVDYLHEGHTHRVVDGEVVECEADHHAVHDQHPHEHGPDCGHEHVAHDGHTDYVHDGHRHAGHDGHYDEH